MLHFFKFNKRDEKKVFLYALVQLPEKSSVIFISKKKRTKINFSKLTKTAYMESVSSFSSDKKDIISSKGNKKMFKSRNKTIMISISKFQGILRCRIS